MCLLQEFCWEQDRSREEVVKVVEAFTADSRQMLLTGCNTSLKTFLEANGFGGSSVRTLHAVKEDSALAAVSASQELAAEGPQVRVLLTHIFGTQCGGWLFRDPLSSTVIFLL